MRHCNCALRVLALFSTVIHHLQRQPTQLAFNLFLCSLNSGKFNVHVYEGDAGGKRGSGTHELSVIN